MLPEIIHSTRPEEVGHMSHCITYNAITIALRMWHTVVLASVPGSPHSKNHRYEGGGGGSLSHMTNLHLEPRGRDLLSNQSITDAPHTTHVICGSVSSQPTHSNHCSVLQFNLEVSHVTSLTRLPTSFHGLPVLFFFLWGAWGTRLQLECSLVTWLTTHVQSPLNLHSTGPSPFTTDLSHCDINGADSTADVANFAARELFAPLEGDDGRVQLLRGDHGTCRHSMYMHAHVTLQIQPNKTHIKDL